MQNQTLLSDFVSGEPSGETLLPGAQSFYRIAPLEDPRWRRFLARHPRSSIFHTNEWLESLRCTYGYTPLALTTSPPDEDLRDAVVFCHIKSRLTGSRLVSLPFSDHCDFLGAPADILSGLATDPGLQHARFIEVRPSHSLDTSAFPGAASRRYWLHRIDLRPDLGTLFRRCHKDSTQRKIRRAEREGLTYEEGQSDRLLEAFYRLLVLTRRRHSMIPQPKQWFGTLCKSFGTSLKIRVAFRGSDAVAAIITIAHKDTLLYKYGGSDAALHRLGGVHLLLWHAIQDAKRDGLQVFDLGRSDWDDTGLATFKDRWGAQRSVITYARVPLGPYPPESLNTSHSGWRERSTRTMATWLPDWMLHVASRLMYRHAG